MKIRVLFNGPAKKLSGWKSNVNIELDEGATGYDLCSYFDIVPGENKLYGFLIRGGKKINESEMLHEGDVVKVSGRATGG